MIVALDSKLVSWALEQMLKGTHPICMGPTPFICPSKGEGRPAPSGPTDLLENRPTDPVFDCSAQSSNFAGRDAALVLQDDVQLRYR